VYGASETRVTFHNGETVKVSNNVLVQFGKKLFSELSRRQDIPHLAKLVPSYCLVRGIASAPNSVPSEIRIHFSVVACHSLHCGNCLLNTKMSMNLMPLV
jgi:hypothetical protein